MAFVQLQVISHFSLLQTTTALEDLVLSAKQRGYNSLALTDFNYMYGQVDFFKLCKKHHIKPLIGIQLEMPGLVLTDQTFTMVFLAKNYVGYQKLLELSTVRSTNDFLALKKAMEIGMENIFAITPGETGEIEQLLLQNEQTKAEEVAEAWKQLFPAEHFFIGVQIHHQLQQLIKPLTEIANKLTLLTVAMHDVRYLNKNDYFSTNVLKAIGDGEQIEVLDGTITGTHFLPEEAVDRKSVV